MNNHKSTNFIIATNSESSRIMREVQFVGEIDIELQGVIGSTAFLGFHQLISDFESINKALTLSMTTLPTMSKVSWSSVGLTDLSSFMKTSKALIKMVKIR